jgi:hypothetical protein
MPVTVLQLLNAGVKTCIPEHKKDFSARRSYSGFDSRVIKHAGTARNDGEREGSSFRNTVLVMVTLSRPSSFRAVVSAVLTVTARIVCERESRNLQTNDYDGVTTPEFGREKLYSRTQERFLDSSKL